MNIEAKEKPKLTGDLKKYFKYWPPDMSDEEIIAAIEESGLKGRLGVKTIRAIPLLELLNLCISDYPIHQIAVLYDRSSATIAALRKFYEIRKEDLVQKGLLPEPKRRMPKESDNKKEGFSNKKAPFVEKIITGSAEVLAGEVIGTAKLLDRMKSEEVTVEVRVWRSVERS